MPIYLTRKDGNIWDEIGKAGLILTSATSHINNRGQVAIAFGCGSEMFIRYKTIKREIGNVIKAKDLEKKLYGVIISEVSESGTRMGVFQVKKGLLDKASIDIVEYSVDCMLSFIVDKFDRIAMTCPPAGGGKSLPMEDVLDVLDKLPNKVIIYKPSGYEGLIERSSHLRSLH